MGRNERRNVDVTTLQRRLRPIARHLANAVTEHPEPQPKVHGIAGLQVAVLPAVHGHEGTPVHVPSAPLACFTDPCHRTGPAGVARLTDDQRDECIAAIARDSYCILPIKLPPELITRMDDYISRYCDAACADPSALRSGGMYKPLTNGTFYHQFNLVELDPVFREMLTFRPALQLCYDCFGPMFHLGQEKWTRKFSADDPHTVGSAEPTDGIGWHSDGPHGFPEIDGRVPFHTLRLGYMLSDTTHDGQTGTLECFRGSHRLKAANAQPVGKKQNWPVSLNPRNFPGTEGDAGTDPSQYSENHVVHKAPAGTIISFQNGMWHRALPNLTATPRTIVWFQYCPCMIHPLHRDSPYPGDLSPFSPVERWLLGEPRVPNRWTYGEGDDWERMSDYRRDSVLAMEVAEDA